MANFYRDNTEIIIHKISESVKELKQEMQAVNTRMLEISDSFEQLSYISKKSNDDKLSTSTYKNLSTILKTWADTYTKHSELIDVEIREYFNFMRREMVTFKEVISITIEYRKSEDS